LLFVQHKTFVYYRMHQHQHTYRYRTVDRFCSKLAHDLNLSHPFVLVGGLYFRFCIHSTFNNPPSVGLSSPQPAHQSVSLPLPHPSINSFIHQNENLGILLQAVSSATVDYRFLSS
jgi:hypothetical protein